MDSVRWQEGRKFTARCHEGFVAGCRLLGVTIRAPSDHQLQLCLLIVGVVLIVAGLTFDADAQFGLTTRYNDVRISNAVNAVLTYLEGTFGALVMVAAGVGAILSSAFGQYRAALGLLVVAVGAFILRSLVSTFFNDATIQA